MKPSVEPLRSRGQGAWTTQISLEGKQLRGGGASSPSLGVKMEE